MKTKTSALLLVACGLLFVASSLGAARERDDTPARVTLFARTHFTGPSLTLRAGEYLDDLNHVRFHDGRIANNRISSIRIEGNARVELYNYRSFDGERLVLRDSVSDLSRLGHDWNNRLSSIRVEDRPEWAGRPGPERPRRDDDDFVGPRFPRQPDAHPWERPRTDSARPGRPSADPVVRMVEAAYRDVLRREADLSGLSGYTRAVHNRGWSESRLRDELRRSDEFRTVTAPTIVKEIYHEVLKREADPAGLAYYSRKVAYENWTDDRVRAALRNSPEFRHPPRSIPAPREERPRFGPGRL